MSNVVNLTKKTFTWSVVVTTILWSMGIAALIPAVANAAADGGECPELQAGDEFKLPNNPAVYVVNADGERMYYPNGNVRKTHMGSDFSNVIELPNSTCLPPSPTSPPFGVNFYPGSLVKLTISPDVYVVGSGNKIHRIPSEAVAASLFGSNWASRVFDVADPFWPNASMSSDEVSADMLVDGMVAMMDGTYYQYKNGMLHMVDGTVPSYLPYVSLSQTMKDSMDMGDSVTAASLTSDPTQGAGGSSSSSDDSSDDGDDDDEDNASAGSSLSVSLSGATPPQATVPQKATHVPYLTFNLRGGSLPVNVTGITLKRVGLGDDNNFNKVWVAIDDVPVSNDQSVNSDDTVNLTPTITVGAGATVTVQVLADLATAGASTDEQDGFEVVEIQTDGAAVTGLPVRGNEMLYSGFAIGTVTLTTRGAADTVEVGDTEEIIGEFELDYTSANEKDASFESIRLKFTGTTSISDFTNIGLYESGTLVSSRTDLAGDFATFMLMNDKKLIEDGKTRRFEVRADIVDGDDAQTVILNLKDTRDLWVQEIGTGYGSALTNSLDSGNLLKTMTLDAGQFSISLDASNPSNENYSQNTDDIVALVAKVNAGQKVRVDGLKIYFHSDSDESNSAAANELTNINADIERAELWINDKKISTLTAATASGSGTNTGGTIETDEYHYDFDTTFEVEDDDLIKLVVDLESAAVAANQYKFVFDSGDWTTPEYVKTGETVPSGNLSGTATGNNLIMTAATVTFTRNDGYSSGETFVAGAQGIKLFGMLVDAGTASDVRLRTLNFDTNMSTAYLASDYTKYTNCRVLVDGAEPTGLNNDDLSSTGVLNFSGLSHNIPKNSQVQLDLYCDIQTGASATSSLTWTFDASDSTIEDQESNTISGVTDTTSQSLTIATGGTLTVTKDGNTPDADLVVAGQSTAVDLATWSFTGDDDDIYVKDLYIANNSTTSVASTTESGSDFLVKKYELVVGGKVIDSKAPASGKVHFELTGAQRILVPSTKTPVRVTVRAVFNSITQASQTQQEFSLALYALEAESRGPGTDLAVGSITNIQVVSDSLAFLDSSSTQTGNKMTVYKSVPTIATVALSDTVLKNAVMDLYKFSVSADSAGDIGWGQLQLTVTGDCGASSAAAITCIDASTLTLYDSADQSIAATITTNSTGILINLTSVEDVTGGTTETYRLEGTLAAFTAGNAVSIRVKDGASFNPAANTLAIQKTAATANSGRFVWSDYSGTPQSVSNSHWFIGDNVPGLDTAVSSLVKPS